MTSIKKTDFVAQNAGRSVDLGKLERDPVARREVESAGVTMQQLRQADGNRDGKLDAAEAFKVADGFDRDGNAGTLVARDLAGAPTPAGKSVNVLGLMLQNAGLQADPPAARSNDDVLHLGMNPPSRESAGAPHEVAQLRARGINVIAVDDAKVGNDKFKVGSTVHDLTTDAGRAGFTATLGLPADKAAAVAQAIAGAGEDAKDEMAGLAQVWAKAERGERVPSRLIISGHNVGSGPWGDGNGQIRWENLKDLARALPAAAGKVEDLNISACYSGGDYNWGKYKDIFPNVKTIWAYSGSAPGAGSGATTHQASWDQATRGAGTDIAGATTRLVDRGVRKAENITTTLGTGSTSTSGPSLTEAREAVQRGESVFQGYFTGQQAVQNTQTGPLRDYYNSLQRLLQRPDLGSAERREAEARRDQTIRTLFYTSNVAPRFAAANGAQMRAAYQGLGMTAPDFATMTRAQAMASITAFRQTLDSNAGAPQSARDALAVLNGLWNLDSRTVPETWI